LPSWSPNARIALAAAIVALAAAAGALVGGWSADDEPAAPPPPTSATKPPNAYQAVLARETGTLADSRESLLGELRDAAGKRAQARLAARVAAAYARAARRLGDTAVPSAARRPNELLAAALDEAALAYRRLAAATEAGRRDAYDRARGDVRSAERLTRRRLLATLNAVGAAS
jgi:hypothetical protein